MLFVIFRARDVDKWFKQRDEDFDSSYESLIALAQSLGDAKPRATPKDVLDALPNGLYKDWQTPGCDTRCPICLDDVRHSFY